MIMIVLIDRMAYQSLVRLDANTNWKSARAAAKENKTESLKGKTKEKHTWIA